MKSSPRGGLSSATRPRPWTSTEITTQRAHNSCSLTSSSARAVTTATMGLQALAPPGTPLWTSTRRHALSPCAWTRRLRLRRHLLPPPRLLLTPEDDDAPRDAVSAGWRRSSTHPLTPLHVHAPPHAFRTKWRSLLRVRRRRRNLESGLIFIFVCLNNKGMYV